MNYNDFFALAENKGINRIQVTETYIKQNEIQFIDKNLEKYNNWIITKTKTLNKILQIKFPNNGKISRKHVLLLEKTCFLWYNISCS